MCEDEGKEYLPIESLDKQSLSDLNNLEKLLSIYQRKHNINSRHRNLRKS